MNEESKQEEIAVVNVKIAEQVPTKPVYNVRLDLPPDEAIKELEIERLNKINEAKILRDKKIADADAIARNTRKAAHDALVAAHDEAIREYTRTKAYLYDEYLIQKGLLLSAKKTV